MERNGIAEQITALVDNEIFNQEQIKTLQSLISTDENLKFEYQVQSLIKNIVRNRFANARSPVSLKSSVLTQIANESKIRIKINPVRSSFWDFIVRPQFAFPSIAAICIIIVVYFFMFNNKTFDEIALEQNGNNNMFVQARENFNKIIQGKLPVQIFSNDPFTVKEFFKKRGVQYSTSVPMFDDMELVGATVSETKGEKFAHHIYKNSDGKLVYFYQVDQKCIIRDKCLNLSSDLLKMVEEGKYYTYSKNGRSFLVWKHNHNICIIVSNDSINKIESKFVSEKY